MNSKFGCKDHPGFAVDTADEFLDHFNSAHGEFSFPNRPAAPIDPAVFDGMPEDWADVVPDPTDADHKAIAPSPEVFEI